MDANLRFWRAEGQSFFQRFLLWADVLDPLLLLKSSDEIRRTRLLLQNSGKTLSEPIQNDQTKRAFLLSLSSVHPDTDKIIPVLFRPPAFLPICLPLEYPLQQKQIFYGLGAISYAACIGALPLLFMNRYTLKSSVTQLVVKKLLPAPLLGLMSAFTVAVVRSPEFENGIEVMDRNGKVVGVSQKAGEKAVKETALSRAVLFGTTFFLPALLTYFVERAKFAKTPRALASVRMFMITSVLAGMLPVSLSMFPQCGEIKRTDLEPEILSSTEETELFYNRGI
ncbi:sideroflexin-4 isoform X3 [Rissa tridactyla]|uniref:sideroflexin-4 isoform X3 n=1 Tax=Rissa tridactyla TaxID=75485 RepID=UPI0023BA4153|nr:sideroflexin-4 isoform X3 [Rissa tridactyla]